MASSLSSHGSLEFGFHPAETALNPVGGSPVVHLRNANLPADLVRSTRRCARLHRGSLAIADGNGVAEIADPFGSILGFHGPTPALLLRAANVHAV